jgi:hypothetical protein
MTHFDLLTVSTADPYHLLDLAKYVRIIIQMAAPCQIAVRQEKWGFTELYAFSDDHIYMIPHPTKPRRYSVTT